MRTGTTAMVAALDWIPNTAMDHRRAEERRLGTRTRCRRHASRNSRGHDDIQRNPQAAVENMNSCGARFPCSVGRRD